MPIQVLNGPDFHDLARQILENGHRLRFRATGESMQPFILNHDVLEVAPVVGKEIKSGDVLLVETNDGRIIAHRVVKLGRDGKNSIYLIRADNSPFPDGWFRNETILGRVELVQRGDLRIGLTSFQQRLKAHIWVTVAPFAVKFSWLPVWLRKDLRNWLLVW
jgi:signal peptidase